MGGDAAAHADVAAAGSRVAVAWKEFDGKATRLKAMRSDDAGLTWRDVDLAADEGATDQPRLFVAKDGFAVLWNSADKPLRVVAVP